MPQRKQKQGKQRNWQLRDIKSGFELFYKEHNRYPTATEVDSFKYLPSSRSIQRSFGGLVVVRKDLELSGQKDFTKGKHSSERAKKINKRAHKIEKQVHEYLVDIFGLESVHREYFFTDDRRTRTDFFIYSKNGNFSVDVFYPADKHNLIGCLNNKMRIYSGDLMLQYPVIFLQMNEMISEEDMMAILKRKKNKLRKYQYLMGYNKFKEFCKNKTLLQTTGG